MICDVILLLVLLIELLCPHHLLTSTTSPNIHYSVHLELGLFCVVTVTLHWSLTTTCMIDSGICSVIK